MFISKKEKSEIENRLLSLEVRVDLLARSLNTVLDAQTTASDIPKNNAVTQEERERRRAYAKAYYYSKKAKKGLA